MVSNESPTQDVVATTRESVDWNELRARSVQKHGFGSERANIWPRLLNLSQFQHLSELTDLNSSKHNEPHSDEHQIGLDTDRSFVLYPAEAQYDRDTLQAGLHKLLVSLFRKRPKLSYFQGYHDIATVLFLTLPADLQLPCLEKLSLHRLRDSMGVGLEPVLGLLRVTKNLLRITDPEYAEVLEQSSPLPFYALSNLLTLFSHDMPTLPLIQHVFDYLLCRPPIASVYLATAIILSRKREVLRLQEEDEEGMIHSLLSSLPHLVDDSADLAGPEAEPDSDGADDSLAHDNSTFFKEEFKMDESLSLEQEDTKLDELQVGTTETLSAGNTQEADYADRSASCAIAIDNSSGIVSKLTSESRDATEEKPLVQSAEPELENRNEVQAVSTEEKSNNIVTANTLHPAAFAHPQLTLVELLKMADDLYEKYPPSHPGLQLSSIMGPQSVVFTWSESPTSLPSDNTAEAMVAHPELVVYPHVEVDSDEQPEKGVAEKAKRESAQARRRARRAFRKSPFGHVEKKTMVASAVLVLGVAMAVYGIKSRQAPGSGHGLWHAGGYGHGAAKDWKRLAGWLGGALTGISEKILNGVSADT